jgi:uncharacterized protein YkwD
MTLVRPVLVRVLIVALVTAMILPLLPATPADAADSRTAAQIRNRIEYLVNRERARQGVRRLQRHDRTQYWARDHSREMARARRIYHDSNLRNEIPRRATGYGENVARTTASDAASAAMRMFMASSGHRQNILYGRWKRMGIGVAKRGKYTYITQRFFTY